MNFKNSFKYFQTCDTAMAGELLIFLVADERLSTVNIISGNFECFNYCICFFVDTTVDTVPPSPPRTVVLKHSALMTTDHNTSDAAQDAASNGGSSHRDAIDVGEWPAGEYVRVTGLDAKPGVNGRFGTVLSAVFGDERGVSVAVHGPDFTRTVHTIARENLERVGADNEALVRVAWLYARQGNGADVLTRPGATGSDGLLDSNDEQALRTRLAEAAVQAWVGDDEAGSVLRVLECTQSELHDFAPRLSFVRRPAPLPLRVGVPLACWVYPGDDGRADGRTNVLATFLTAGLDGRVVTPVVGTCFVVRLCPHTGDVVDFTRDEATRLLFFLKDAVDFVASRQGAVPDSTWNAWKAAYRFYEQGCVLTHNGFTGMRTCTVDDDGNMALDPSDMQPVDGSTT